MWYFYAAHCTSNLQQYVTYFCVFLLITHSGIASVSVENDVLGLTLVAAKVLLDKIHWIYLDNFSVETCLKSVNSGGKNLGFGGGFGYHNNTIRKWHETAITLVCLSVYLYLDDVKRMQSVCLSVCITVCLYLDDVKRMPLTPPNVDRATKRGMIHAMTPYRRSANTSTTQDNSVTIIYYEPLTFQSWQQQINSH